MSTPEQPLARMRELVERILAPGSIHTYAAYRDAGDLARIVREVLIPLSAEEETAAILIDPEAMEALREAEEEYAAGRATPLATVIPTAHDAAVAHYQRVSDATPHVASPECPCRPTLITCALADGSEAEGYEHHPAPVVHRHAWTGVSPSVQTCPCGVIGIRLRRDYDAWHADLTDGVTVRGADLPALQHAVLLALGRDPLARPVEWQVDG